VSVLSIYHKLKEHIRIYRFKISENLKDSNIFSELLQRRWKTILSLVILVTTSFLADFVFAYWVIPVLNNQSWFNTLSSFLQFPDSNAVINLLSAIISGVAAVIGILLAISLLILQLAAERYPYRVVRFLIQEKVGAYVVDFLILSLLFSLWTLFLLNRGAIFPYISIVVALVLATLSIIFVFVYRDYSLYFFRPQQGFEAVASEAKRAIYAIFNKGESLGPSVTKHLREKTGESVQVIQDFIIMLSKKKDQDLWFGSINLASILSYYVTEKRFINSESNWFPLIDVPTSSQRNLTSYELLAPFEELALGERYFQKQDVEWLEKQILSAMDIAQTKTLKINDLMCINSIMQGYTIIIEKCFDHQELPILDLTLLNVESFLDLAIKRNRLDKCSQYYNVMILVAERAIQGLGIDKVKPIIQKITWFSENEILKNKLPKVFNDELLSYQKKIETEIILEKKVVTPKNIIENDLVNKFVDVESEISQKYYCKVFELLAKIHFDAYSKRSEREIRNVLLVELRILRRGIVLNKIDLAQKNIDTTVRQSIQGYEILKDNKTLRNEIFMEMKLGCFNAIKSKDVVCFGKLYNAFSEITSLEFEDGENFFPEEALESLMTIASLAYLHSEFYQDKALFCTVEGILYAKFNLNVLIAIFKQLLKRRGINQSMEYKTKYHHWFKDIFLEILNLPRISKERSPQFKSLDMVYDHPSELIQNSHISLDIDECTEAMVEQLRGLIAEK
jgi:hypothetical protein